MVLLLRRDDLAQVLDPDSAALATAAAFAAHSSGRTVTPVRGVVAPPGANGVLLSMPGAVHDVSAEGSAGALEGSAGALGAKIVSIFPDNPARGLPRVTSFYLLCDYQTGVPLAVLDGTYLTAVRTAAGSAVATRLLAREDATTLGVFGTGVQARFHVRAIRRVRPLSRVLVAGTSRAKEAEFARWIAESEGLDAEPAPPEVASAADIVTTCTTSPTPVVIPASVHDGAHINAVGAFTPATRELPGALIARAAVYVDSRDGAFAEAGDLLLPVDAGIFSLDRIRGEVGEVVLGEVASRRDAQEITIYKSVGAAFLDAVAARLAYEQARQRHLGLEFDFG